MEPATRKEGSLASTLEDACNPFSDTEHLKSWAAGTGDSPLLAAVAKRFPEAVVALQDQWKMAWTKAFGGVTEERPPSASEETAEGRRALAEWRRRLKQRDYLKYYLVRREEAPQAAGFEKHEDRSPWHVKELIAKLILYAPQVWYEVLTGGLPRPNNATNDASFTGVAYDASSRLMRLRIDYFHEKLTEKQRAEFEAKEQVRWPYSFFVGVQDPPNKRPRVLRNDSLPPAENSFVRVVMISDTHLMQDKLSEGFPAGDILVHAGDLSYEESRSLDGRDWDNFKQECGGTMIWNAELEKLLDGLEFTKALRWLGSRPGFSEIVLTGGNHDYVLEGLGKEFARKWCKKFNVTYLHQDDAPLRVPLRRCSTTWRCSLLCRPFVMIWGSAVSFQSGLSETRAIASGNCAFQVGEAELGDGQDRFRRAADSVRQSLEMRWCCCCVATPLGIMITHGPAAAPIHLGGKNKTFAAVADAVFDLDPDLYICGHSHNGADLFKERTDVIKTRNREILGVNAACLGTWNHFHGAPVIVDVKFATAQCKCKWENLCGGRQAATSRQLQPRQQAREMQIVPPAGRSPGRPLLQQCSEDLA